MLKLYMLFSILALSFFSYAQYTGLSLFPNSAQRTSSGGPGGAAGIARVYHK